MSNDDTDTTQWSLPGPADAPRDDLKLQLEVYGETILMRGFEGGSAWLQDRLGGRDRQRVHPAPGLLLGAACPRMPSGGTRARPGRWWPSGGRRRSGPSPCNGRRSSPPHGSGFPCRGWSSSARRGARPGSTPQAERPDRRRAAALPGPRLQRLQRRAGLPRKPPVPRGGGPDTGRLLPVLLLPYRRHPQPLEEAPRKPARRYGRRLMEQTEYPMEDLVPQCTVAQAIAVSEGRRGYRYG